METPTSSSSATERSSASSRGGTVDSYFQARKPRGRSASIPKSPVREGLAPVKCPKPFGL